MDGALPRSIGPRRSQMKKITRPQNESGALRLRVGNREGLGRLGGFADCQETKAHWASPNSPRHLFRDCPQSSPASLGRVLPDNTLWQTHALKPLKPLSAPDAPPVAPNTKANRPPPLDNHPYDQHEHRQRSSVGPRRALGHLPRLKCCKGICS